MRSRGSAARSRSVPRTKHRSRCNSPGSVAQSSRVAQRSGVGDRGGGAPGIARTAANRPPPHTHTHASALLFPTLPPPAPLHASPAAREDDGAAGWTLGTEAGLGRICLGHRPPRLLRAVFCLRNSTQTNSTSQLLKVRSSLLLFFVKRSSWGRLIASIVPPPRLTPPTSIRPTTTTTTTHTQRQHACALPRHFYPPSSITSIRRNFFERVFGSVTSSPRRTYLSKPAAKK